jgi:hypothetical protein
VPGVRRPGLAVRRFDERWADPVLRKDVLHVAQALESERSILGVSAHLLGIGLKSESAPC